LEVPPRIIIFYRNSAYPYYSDTMANIITTTVPFRSIETLSYPLPDPDDSSHRFYLCRPSVDTKDVMRCTKQVKEVVDKIQQSSSQKVVAIHVGYPQILDQIILSAQLKTPVALG
jgi:hypothetical protein